MAAGLLAALFAMGVFSAQGVLALGGGNEVIAAADQTYEVVRAEGSGRRADLEITFTAAAAVAADDSTSNTVTLTDALEAWNIDRFADGDAIGGVTLVNDDDPATAIDIISANLGASGVKSDVVITFPVNTAVAADTYTLTIPLTLSSANGDSNTAGADVRLSFSVTGLAAIEGDPIVIGLEDFGLPAVIAASDVRITATDTSDASVSGSPEEASVSGSNVTLIFTELDPDVDDREAIVATDVVTISFRTSVGISNPVHAGDYDITVTDEDGTEVTVLAYVIRTIGMGPTSGASGSEVTITGKGFTDGSATVFIDTHVDHDGDESTEPPADEPTEREPNAEFGEDDTTLGTASVEDGTFILTTDAIDATATVNAIDSNGDTAAEGAPYTVEASISVSPEEIAPAETLTISLIDWGDIDDVTAVRFGGVTDVSDITDYDGGSDTTLEVVVPGSTRTGTIKVEVLVDGVSEASSSIEVVPLSLSLSPSTAVSREQITIQGSGFTDDKGIDTITIGGETVSPDGASASSSGNIVITVTVPDEVGAGSQTVKVTDDEGRIGTAELTVPAPAITLDPATSRRGSTVNVSGSGFPANDLILVQYPDNDGKNRTVGTGATDSTGSFSSSFTVPSFAGIGASSKVTAVSSVNDVDRSATADHSLPGSMLSVSPAAVESGGMVTITGQNMAVFAAISNLMIGAVEVTPVPAPSTDTNGEFSARVLVPQLELGNQRVSVTVGGRTTTTFLDVVVPSTSGAPAEVFAGLGDRLVRVWYLERSTQVWSFYDPDPVNAVFNTLTEVSSGQNVSIIVNAGATIGFQGDTLYAGTNPIALD